MDPNYVSGVGPYRCTAQQCITIAMNDCTAPWTLLAISGLNPLTLFTQAFTVIALVVAICLTPSVSPLVLGFTFFNLGVAALAYLSMSVVVERFRRSMFLSEVLLARELHASQTADSILNHTLKNTLADVAGIIEMFLAGAQERGTLEDAMACLRRGMKSCRERQVYLKLVGGEYTPVVNEVHLQEFGESLIVGRAVTGRFPDMAIQLDQMLCNLILENALSNAFKHGDPQGPDVQFHIEVEPSPLPQPQPSSQSEAAVRVTFTVSNAANPLRPVLTEEVVTKLLSGQVADAQPQEVKPVLSDRIGLSHCLMAAKQGGLTVALWQAEGRVHFCITMDTVLVTAECVVDVSEPVSPITLFPAGLSFVVMDDSLCAQRLLEFHIRRSCNPGEVRCFGADEGDVVLFLQAAQCRADIVITDQHLEYSQTYLGTDLVRQLVANGFPGLLCIRSGDDSAEDRAKYAESGAHCSFAKDVPGAQLMEELKRAYVQLKQVASPQPPSPSARWANLTAAAAPRGSRPFHTPSTLLPPVPPARLPFLHSSSQVEPKDVCEEDREESQGLS
eukprot:GGOE01013007.1.p1 GENE.GGOE01013007.1~~GGOE01013007.1.p1  ORF type:complete len:560 (-),score=116.12 GGOE01013007.1:676-2355(-)